MDSIEYFKLLAKNLLKDYKSRSFDENKNLYIFKPKFFDVNAIFSDFDLPFQKEDFLFTLTNSQHTIAKIAGFSNWADLKSACNENAPEVETAKKLLNNSRYKLPSKNNPISVERNESKLLPAPQNFYAWIIPDILGTVYEFSFNPVEYAVKYMIYYSKENDISTAKPMAEGSFSPIKHIDRTRSNYAPYYWVRAFDGKNYGEWSEIAQKNR